MTLTIVQRFTPTPGKPGEGWWEDREVELVVCTIDEMVRSGGMVPAGYRITYPPLHFVKDHYQEGLLIGRVNGEQVPLGEFDFRLNQLTRGEWDRATLRDAIFAHRCWASLIKKESA